MIACVAIGQNKVIDVFNHDEVEAVSAIGFDVGNRMISGGGSIVKVWQEKMHLDEEEEEEAVNGNGTGKRAPDSDDSDEDEDSDDDSDSDAPAAKQKRKKRKKAGKLQNTVVRSNMGTFKGLD
jgi:hypothetical protein